MSRSSIARENAVRLKAARRMREASVDYSSDRPTLAVREPTTGRIDELDMRWASSLSALRGQIAVALMRICDGRPGRSGVTNTHLIHHLDMGLSRFLVQTGRTGIGVQDLDRDLFSAFHRWLDGPGVRGKQRSANYKIDLHMAAVTLVMTMRSADRVDAATEPLPTPPWKPARASGSKDLVVMDEADVRDIVRACARLVETTSDRVLKGLNAIDADTGRTGVLARYSDVPLRERDVTSLAAYRPALLKDLRASGLDDARLILRPTLMDVAPFVILLAFAFRLNDAVIRSAHLSDFAHVPSLGGSRVVARPLKARSHKRVHASVPVTRHATNPAQMLALLDRWLTPARADLGTDRLVAVSSNRSVSTTMEGPNGKAALVATLRIFAKRHGLAPFSITKLRAFRIDRAHSLTDGNPMAMKVAASHSALDTSRQHYMTRGARLRDDEKLAMGMLGMQSSFLPGGAPAADMPPPRHADAGCTPGWTCVDPAASTFHPPRPDGRCVAYARCPVCPSGRIDFGSAEAAASALALSRAVGDALTTMAPEAWLARLAPIATELEQRIIPGFAEATLVAAAALPPLTLPTPD